MATAAAPDNISGDIVIEQAPIVTQPQCALIPVSTDDIRDLYQTPEELEEYYSLGLGVFRRHRDRISSPKLLPGKRDDRKV